MAGGHRIGRTLREEFPNGLFRIEPDFESVGSDECATENAAGQTGEVVSPDSRPGVCEFSGLARLAALLKRDATAATFVGLAIPAWEMLLKDKAVNAYAASESLAAMECLVK